MPPVLRDQYYEKCQGNRKILAHGAIPCLCPISNRLRSSIACGCGRPTIGGRHSRWSGAATITLPHDICAAGHRDRRLRISDAG